MLKERQSHSGSAFLTELSISTSLDARHSATSEGDGKNGLGHRGLVGSLLHNPVGAAGGEICKNIGFKP